MRRTVLLLLASSATAIACTAPAPTPAPAPARTASPASAPTARGEEVGAPRSVPRDPLASPTLLGASPPQPQASPDAPALPDLAAVPPYDLASDRERRAKLAKDELGARTSTAVVSDIFVVIGPTGWQGEAFDRSVALTRSAMAGFMNGRFARKPERAISVYLFGTGATYEAFCKKKYDAPCIAHYGFYQPSDRAMVMNAGLGLGTLTHELVHPLVEADFPGAPTWINEGIASVFEAPVIPKAGEIRGVKNWRHPRLLRAMKSAAEKEHARLDVLFGMSDETFRGDAEDLHYAMARYVCQWLDEKGKLWPFYQRWRDHRAEDPTGARSFEEVFGKKPAEAHADWAKWVMTI